MSNNKCGLSPKQREQALHRYGFEPTRNGKGSHVIWEHPELKLLSRTHKIAAPANLGSGQNPWEIIVPDNPASGTWRSITKQADWCQKTTEQIKTGSAHDRQRCEVAGQFRKAAGAYGEWKNQIRRLVNAGLDINKAPVPPISYKDLQSLRKKTQSLLPS